LRCQQGGIAVTPRQQGHPAGTPAAPRARSTAAPGRRPGTAARRGRVLADQCRAVTAVHPLIAYPRREHACPCELLLRARDRRQPRRREVDADRAGDRVRAAARCPLQARGDAVGGHALRRIRPTCAPLDAASSRSSRESARAAPATPRPAACPAASGRARPRSRRSRGRAGTSARHGPCTRVTTRTSDGVRGVEPNPNRTGGSTVVKPP